MERRQRVLRDALSVHYKLITSVPFRLSPSLRQGDFVVCKKGEWHLSRGLPAQFPAGMSAGSGGGR